MLDLMQALRTSELSGLMLSDEDLGELGLEQLEQDASAAVMTLMLPSTLSEEEDGEQQDAESELDSLWNAALQDEQVQTPTDQDAQDEHLVTGELSESGPDEVMTMMMEAEAPSMQADGLFPSTSVAPMPPAGPATSCAGSEKKKRGRKPSLKAKESMTQPRPPSVSVDVVLRQFPNVEGLDHVATEIKSFLDVSPIVSVSTAAQFDSLSLLQLAVTRETRKLRSWSSELRRAYRQREFANALNVAAGRGFIAGLRWLRMDYLPKGKFQGVERAAMYSGRLDVLKFLHEEYPNKMEEDALVDSQDAVAHAAANGRLDLVQWYCEQKGPYAFGWNVMDAAVAQNHMEVVLYLDTHVGNRCTRRGLELAAVNGHLNVVKWLNDTRYYEIRTFRTLENAIAGGHLHIVQYIMQTVEVAYTSWTQAALTAAPRSEELWL
ncbi:hypothetical protein PHYBOEH_009437 [Phytophthora boehmeriae]|uniref:Ankyrin repeat-containing domain n=1 Tax=Phytophthora boehmeriae TaxID=109152 RepID=A0A8T1VWV6_9STRA|nr:hypothetical protein PHYBOEH_009437 [Phytophthora boehmeriae]